ncbi:MAG: hypothetical protein F6K50_31285 [Moorea sp. SIO3I7]|uniref:hypothetical protein n=1 Tax=Moorena sp. SIO3I8 TaxID=2607833 RepID=UPI0013C1EB63|nr:hypothetical protein [Moorena sp. SIO3I8]NEN99798.1 hypothetical protein [Moorena sp. SIO3I7]NEO08241.1 hypothetical protein [Moorena sp. SIO3I8]
MNVEELETRYREEIQSLANQLQNAVLGLSQTEAKIAKMGRSIENLSEILQEFLLQQNQKN